MSNYAATGKTTKLAWIHDGPTGVASPGHFNCPCGNVISGVEYAGPDSTCSQCGRVWDGRGWLVSAPARPVPVRLSGCTCGGIGDTGSHYATCLWAMR